jgi:hypothetical protein
MSERIQFSWRYFLQYNSFFSVPDNLGLSYLTKSETLPVFFVFGISCCLFGWWLDTLQKFSKCSSYFLWTVLSSTMFATKRLFFFSTLLFVFRWFEHLNWVHLPITQWLIETRASVAAVLRSISNGGSDFKWI